MQEIPFVRPLCRSLTLMTLSIHVTIVFEGFFVGCFVFYSEVVVLIGGNLDVLSSVVVLIGGNLVVESSVVVLLVGCPVVQSSVVVLLVGCLVVLSSVVGRAVVVGSGPGHTPSISQMCPGSNPSLKRSSTSLTKLLTRATQVSSKTGLSAKVSMQLFVSCSIICFSI